MKHLKFRIGLLALGLFSQVGALSSGGLRSGQATVWGEALYWKPTNSGTEWAMGFSGPMPQMLNAQSNGSYTTKAICHDYKAGFQVGGRYRFDCPCLFAQLSGGYIQFKNGSHSTGELTATLPLQSAFTESSSSSLNGALPIVGRGRGDLQSHYWNVDLRVGALWEPGCTACFAAFGGARYVNLEERLDARIAGTTLGSSIVAPTPSPIDLRQRRRMEFSGAGPELGVGGNFRLCQWIGVDMESAAVVLIGTRKTASRALLFGELIDDLESVSLDANQRFGGNNCVAIVPGFTLRWAVSTALNWSCLQFEGRLGYQIDYYWDAFNQTIGSVSINPGLIAQPNLRDAGFAGPFIRGSLSF